MLYTASHDGTAIAWDVAGERGLENFRFTRDLTPDPAGFDGHPGIFSPDGRLAAVGLKDQGIRLQDTHPPRPGRPPLEQTSGEVWALDFSQDGGTLAAVTVSGRATLWDVEERVAAAGPFSVGRGAVLGIDISADGEMLAAPGPTA